MEKQPHQEYRDQLAQDLKKIEDHGDRAHSLDLEKLSFRYDDAKAAHLKDVAEHIQDFEDKKNKAKEFERTNSAKLANKEGSWGSPRDLLKMAMLWLDANEPEKAEQYFLQAGSYGYESAAINFEKIGDQERAKKFWVLLAENPTGYSEDIPFNKAYAWDKAGDIPKAIEAWEIAKSNVLYYERVKPVDNHGDVKVASGDVATIEKRIEKLKKMLEEKN